MEFSGHDESGNRVMGLLAAKGLASVVDAHRDFLWSVPENWSLKQAATVPVAYSTAFYALVVRGRIRAGETVLIHCGSGAVGQAAISIALQRGCRVVTTDNCRIGRQTAVPEADISTAEGRKFRRLSRLEFLADNTESNWRQRSGHGAELIRGGQTSVKCSPTCTARSLSKDRKIRRIQQHTTWYARVKSE